MKGAWVLTAIAMLATIGTGLLLAANGIPTPSAFTNHDQDAVLLKKEPAGSHQEPTQKLSSREVSRSGVTTVYINGITIYALSNTGQIIDEGIAGTDDSRVIQAALDATASGVVLIQDGTYTLTGPTVSHPKRGSICIDKSNIHLMGEGDATVLQSRTTNDEYAIVVNGQEFDHLENVTVSDLRIELGSPDQVQAGYGGIWLWYTDHCRIDNVSIVSHTGWTDEAISWEGIYLFSGEYNIVTNCIIEGIGGGDSMPEHEGNALNLQKSDNNIFDAVAISDCIHGIHVGYGRWEWDAHASNNNTFSNFTIDGSQKGIYINSESQDNRFVENSVVNSRQVGAHLESGASNNFMWCTYRNAPIGMLVSEGAIDTYIENCYFSSHSDSDLIDEGTGTVTSNNSYEAVRSLTSPCGFSIWTRTIERILMRWLSMCGPEDCGWEGAQSIPVIDSWLAGFTS